MVALVLVNAREESLQSFGMALLLDKMGVE
jgi:hypothetical protein